MKKRTPSANYATSSARSVFALLRNGWSDVVMNVIEQIAGKPGNVYTTK
jgi:hypothetical protein